MKRPDGAAPTFCDGEFAGDEFRKALLDRVEALAQRVVFGVGDAGRVVLIVALVVAFELQRQPHVLDLGLRLGEVGDVGELFGFRGSGHGEETHAVAAFSSRSAAALASAVISAPASMRAISSRR